MTIRAKYEKGVFKPLESVLVDEGTIVEIELPPADARNPRERNRRSVREFAITGMWKDRKDIVDGITYVNRLRDNPRP